MANPYQAPEESAAEDEHLPPPEWSFYTRVAVAIVVAIIFILAIDLPWRMKGLPWSRLELQMWLTLGSSVAVLAFAISRLKEKFPNEESVARYCLAIAGCVSLLMSSRILIELYMVWYSGVEFEEFALINRLLGNYAFLYWINEALLCLLPLFICWHGVSKRRWLIIPGLVALCVFAAANLRFSYISNRDEIPSSWSQFFW